MINLVLHATRVLVAGAILGVAAQSGAVIITATSATLASAFATAQGGDVIKLTGAVAGGYLANHSYSSVVTLDARGAVFTGSLTLNNVTNLTLYGARFDLTGAPAYTKGLLVGGGKNIYADYLNVIGSGAQYGAYFNGTYNAQIKHSAFTSLNAGVIYNSVNGGYLAANSFTRATSDGIDVANSHNVTATYNTCSGSVPVPGAHPDCIQLWSVAGKPLQSDITVSFNKANGSTQGFTSFPAGGGGLRLKFLNNVANLSDPQGIACYACIDSTIAYNSVTTLPGSTYQTVINVLGGSGNTVIGNTVGPFPRATPRAFGETADNFAVDADTDLPNVDFTQFARGTFDDAPATLPEPASWAMLITGFAGVGLVNRRRRATGRGDRCMA